MPRSEIIEFADHMEKRLQDNEYKGGWHDCSIGYLESRLQNAVDDLRVVPNEKPDIKIRRAADVANYAMMIADLQKPKEKGWPL